MVTPAATVRRPPVPRRAENMPALDCHQRNSIEQIHNWVIGAYEQILQLTRAYIQIGR